MNMCWIPDEITENGRWPMPDHHPNCDDWIAEEAERLIKQFEEAKDG